MASIRINDVLMTTVNVTAINSVREFEENFCRHDVSREKSLGFVGFNCEWFQVIPTTSVE